MTELIRVENLKKHFPIRKGILRKVKGQVKAVDGVSFSISEKETLGLVGESGCGKTTIGRTILKLLEPNGGRPTIGEALGESWQRFRANDEMLVIAFLLTAVLIAALSSVLSVIAIFLFGAMFSTGPIGLSGNELVAILIFGAAIYLLPIPALAFFVTGWITIALKIIRGQKPRIADLFANSGKILPATGGMALIALGPLVGHGLSLLLFYLAMTDLEAFSRVLLSLIGLLLPIIGTVFSLMTFFTPWLIADKNMGALEAIRASMKITLGHKWYLLSFTVAASVLVQLGSLLFGFGLLIVLPLLAIAASGIYEFFAKTAFEPEQHAAEWGGIAYRGRYITGLPSYHMRPLRKNLQIIFQDPYASLNPRMTVGKIIREGLDIHKIGKKKDRDAMVAGVLERVGLPRNILDRYPHEFSGGQRQRVGIARALIMKPEFIVCDEAISALDVSIQAQIINLLADLKEEYGIAYLFIAHDLSVVEHISDRVAVMYLGKIVELAETKELFSNPLHPYTRALLSSVPQPDPTLERERIVLQGDVPSPIAPPRGCSFHPRCPLAVKGLCDTKEPMVVESNGHQFACHVVEEELNASPQNPA